MAAHPYLEDRLKCQDNLDEEHVLCMVDRIEDILLLRWRCRPRWERRSLWK